MDRQSHEYRQVKIADMLLNPLNPRFNPVQYQKETILSMIEDQGEKLITLAEHILQNGLNPTDIISVFPHQSQWLVLEGNRRVTVLKLLNEPDLVPSHLTKLKRSFQKLSESLDSHILENIPCIVFENREAANEWIRLKHTGENEGAGIVRWDSQQTSRFQNQVSQTIDYRMVFLDSLKNSTEIPVEYREHFANIKKTNFDRLIGDPDVRKLVGVQSAGGELSFINGVNAYFLEIIYDLIFTDFNVGQIYRKENRKNYIDSIIKRVQDKEKKLQLSQVHPIKTGKQSQQDNHDSSQKQEGPSEKNISPPNSNETRGRSYPINRKTLIPSHHKLAITHARIAKIFNELKALDIDTYPNAAAVLFRVFIELCADCYISKYSIIIVTVNSTLQKKIEAVAKDLEDKGILTKYELRAVRQMVSSDTQNTSIKTFHSYVHNKDVTPSSADLKSAWDDLWPFIEGMWR